MPKPAWIDICDEIVTRLNNSTDGTPPTGSYTDTDFPGYTGPLAIDNDAKRGYWPEFSGLDLKKLQVLVGPHTEEIGEFTSRCMTRDRNELQITVHIVKAFETLEDIDAILQLVDDVIEICHFSKPVFAGKTSVNVLHQPIYDQDAYEHHRAIWSAPTFTLR